MNPLEGITDETVMLSTTPAQFAVFERDLPAPDKPRVTHKISVGPHYLPGVYVVTAVQRDTLGNPNSHRVVLQRLEAV